MGIQIPPEIAWAVSWAAGGDWPKPDEDHVRAIGAVWKGVSHELDRVAAAVDPVTARVLGSVKGAAASAFGSFASRLRQTIPSMAGAADDIGTMSVNTAQQVEYAKYMILAQSAWLAAEIVALASSFYGSALIPAEITAVRINVQLILRRAFKAVVSAAVTQAAMDAAVQGIQFLKGDRTEWDVQGTALGAAMGAMGGAIGMPISLAGSALAPKLSQTVVGHAVTGAVSGVAVGAATNLAFDAGQDLGLAAGAGAIGGATGWRHRPGGTSPTGVENVEGVPEVPKLSQDVTGEVATSGHTTDGTSTGHPSDEPAPTEAAPAEPAPTEAAPAEPAPTEAAAQTEAASTTGTAPAGGTESPHGERQLAETPSTVSQPTRTEPGADAPVPGNAQAPDATGTHASETERAQTTQDARAATSTASPATAPLPLDGTAGTTGRTTPTASADTRARSATTTGEGHGNSGSQQRDETTTAAPTAGAPRPETRAATSPEPASQTTTGGIETERGAATTAPATATRASGPATAQPEQHAAATAPATSTTSTPSATVETARVEPASSPTVASQAPPSVPHSAPEHMTGLPGMEPAAKTAEQPASPHLTDTVVASGTHPVEHGPSTAPESPPVTHADPTVVVPPAHQLGKAAGEPLHPGLPGLEAKGMSTQAVQPERVPTQAVRAVAEPPVGETPVRLSSAGTDTARPLPTVAAHDPAAHSPLRTAGGPPRTGEPATASHGATTSGAAEPRTSTSTPTAAADSNGQPVHAESPQGSHHDDRRDPPDGGGDPFPPHPRSDDAIAAHPSASRVPEYVPAPDHAQASPEQQRHWEQAQRELHGAYDGHLTEAAKVAGERAEVRERLDAAFTQWSSRLPEHSPEEFAVAVRRRAEEVVTAELAAEPESRERILGDLHGRLELAAVREAAVRVGMARFERTVDVSSRQLAAPGDEFAPRPALSRELVGRAREHLSGVFRDRVEKAVAETYRTPEDVGEALPERTVRGERALDGLTAALPRDLDLRVGFETAWDSADRAVEHTAGTWRNGLDAAGERLLEQTGAAADAGVSEDSLRLLRTTLREQVESDFTAVFSSVDSADDFHGSPQGAVADFNGRFEQRLEELPRRFAVQAAREAAIRTVLDTVHETAGVWHEQGLSRLDKATAETFGLSGPVPEHLADRVAAEMARGVDGRLLRTRDAEMDTWRETFGELTAADRIHDLLTLHSAREHGFRAAEGQARERVAAWREDHALSDDAAERVREGHTERVREAFDEVFPTPDALLGDGVADRLQRWRDTRQALDDDLAAHLAFESEVMPALEGAARGFDALAADKDPLPFAELSDLKERYGEEWFTQYREHWGPERLDADKWLAHEATHENTFRVAEGDDPADHGRAQSLSPLDDGSLPHEADRWPVSHAPEGDARSEVFPELPAKYAESELEELDQNSRWRILAGEDPLFIAQFQDGSVIGEYSENGPLVGRVGDVEGNLHGGDGGIPTPAWNWYDHNGTFLGSSDGRTENLPDVGQASQTAPASLPYVAGRAVDPAVIHPTPVWSKPSGADIYRNSEHAPERVFEEGFPPKGVSIPHLVDYVFNGPQDTVFVSATTMDNYVEQTMKQTGRVTKYRHIYAIDPLGGIDINATLDIASPFPDQQEIVFPGGVQSRFIKYAQELSTIDGTPVGDRIPNPHYQPLTAEESATHRPQPGPPEQLAPLAPVTPGGRVADFAAPDTWTHRSDNAPSALLHSERFDPAGNPLDRSRFPGTLAGAQTLIRAEVRRIQADNGTWVRDHTVALPVRLDRTVTPHDLTTLNTRLQESLDAHVNTGYALPRSGDQLHVTLHLFHDDHHPEHLVLSRTSDPAPTDQRHWYLPQDSNDTAPLSKFTHEVLHYLGLPDEYLKENFLFRLDKERPAVHSDDALMVQADRFTPLPERYLTTIENTVDTNTVLHDHPLTPRSEDDPAQVNHNPAPDSPTGRWSTARSPESEESSSGQSQHSVEQFPTEAPAIGIRKDPFGGWRLDEGTPLTVDDRSGLKTFVEKALRADAPTGERLQARILLGRLEQLSLGKHPTDPITERISQEQRTALGEVHREIREYYESVLATASPVSDAVLVPKKVHFVWFGKPMSPHGMANVLRWADHISRANEKLPPGKQWEVNLWTDPKFNAKGSKNAWQAATERLRKVGVTVHTDTAEKVAGAARSVQEKYRQRDPDGSQGLAGLPDLGRIYRAGLKEGAFNLGSDIARYAVLAEQGGVYADVDLGPGRVSWEDMPDIRMRRDDVPLLSPGLRDANSLLKELRDLGRRAQTGSSDSGGPVTPEDLLAAAESRYKKGHLGNHFIVAPPNSDFINLLNERIPQKFQEISASSSKNGPDLTREAAAISGPGLIHFVRQNQSGSALGEYVGDVLGLWRTEPTADWQAPPGLRSRDLVALFDPQLLRTWEGLEWVTDESAHQLDPMQQPGPADAPMTAPSGAHPTADVGPVPTDVRGAGDSEVINRWRTLSALPWVRRSDALWHVDTAVDAWANGGRLRPGDHETNQRQLGAVLDAVEAWKASKDGPSGRTEAVDRLTAHVRSELHDLRRRTEQAQAEEPPGREGGGTEVRPHTALDSDGGSTPHDADRWPTSHAPEGAARADVPPASPRSGESFQATGEIAFGEGAKQPREDQLTKIKDFSDSVAAEAVRRVTHDEKPLRVYVEGGGNGSKWGSVRGTSSSAADPGLVRARAVWDVLRRQLNEEISRLWSGDPDILSGTSLLQAPRSRGQSESAAPFPETPVEPLTPAEVRAARRTVRIWAADDGPARVLRLLAHDRTQLDADRRQALGDYVDESVRRGQDARVRLLLRRLALQNLHVLRGELDSRYAERVAELASPAGALTPVPKDVHFFWMGKEPSAGALNNLEAWARSAGSTWRQHLWTDATYEGWSGQARARLEQIVTVHRDSLEALHIADRPQVLEVYETAVANGAYNLASDIARYLILERFGGVYADVDLHPGTVNLSSMPEITMGAEDLPLLAPRVRDMDSVADALAASGVAAPADRMEQVDLAARVRWDAGVLGNHLIVTPPGSEFITSLLDAIPKNFAALRKHMDVSSAAASQFPEELKNLAPQISGPAMIEDRIPGSEGFPPLQRFAMKAGAEGVAEFDGSSYPTFQRKEAIALFSPRALEAFQGIRWVTEESERQLDGPAVEQPAAGPSVAMAPVHGPEGPPDAPAPTHPARQVPLPADPSTWLERRKEVQERHVGRLSAERFDPAVDAVSRHRAPGTLAGAQTLMRAEVSRIQAENRTWVRDHVVTLPVRLAGSGLSEHDLAGLQAGIQGALDEHINAVGYALPRSGDQFHVELRLVHDDDHPEHVIVSRSDKPGRSDQRHWNLGPPTEDQKYLPVVFHEVFHYLGLPDEYRDLAFLFRRNADSAAVHTDGLMAGTTRLAPLPERYLAAIEDTVDAGVVLHGYGLGDLTANRDLPGAEVSSHHDGWPSAVDWESERWDTAASPRPDGEDATQSAEPVTTPAPVAGSSAGETPAPPTSVPVPFAEGSKTVEGAGKQADTDLRLDSHPASAPDTAPEQAPEEIPLPDSASESTSTSRSDGESMHTADSAPGPVAPPPPEPRHPWYVDHGAYGEIDVAGAARWDPERVETEAAAVARALTGLPGSPAHQRELRAGIERELRALLAADSGEQWSARLRAGHMAEVAGQTVWLRPALREVTPAEGPQHPDGAVQHQVYYGSAKVSSGAERETRSALNAALTTMFTVGAAGLSTVAGPGPQLSVGGSTKRSHTDGFEVVSGRTPKTTGSTDFAAQLHVEVSVDGEVAPHDTVTLRGLTVRFPEVFSSAQEPRPDAVAHPMRPVSPDAQHLTRAPLALQAIDTGPVVVGLVRELRRAGIPAATVAVMMPKFIKELASEDIVRTRSRFWMTTGDSSGLFDESTSVMRRFTGRFTASTVWERAQYVGTTAVKIQEDLGLVTNDRHGRATTGEGRIGGGVDVLGMSATDNGHLGNLSVGASAESSRTVSLGVNSSRAEYTVLTRHEDHARYHVQARVEVVTHSETHRDVRPVQVTVATEILVPLRAAAEFERRMFGEVVTEALPPGEPGTHPVGVDAIAPQQLASGRGQGFGKLIGLPGSERVYGELRRQLDSMMGELGRQPSPADRSRLETLLTTYYGRPALEGDLGVVLAGLDQRLKIGGESFDVSARLHLRDRLEGTETYAMTMDGKAVSREGMQAQRSHGVGLSASANGSAQLKVSDRFKARVGKFQVGGSWNRATSNTLSAETKNHRRTQTTGLVHELAYDAVWEVSVHHPKADAHWWIEDRGNMAAVFAVPEEHTPAHDTPARAADLSPSPDPAPAPADEGYGAVRTLTDWPAAAHIPFEHHSGAVYPVFLHTDELLHSAVEQYRRVNGILPGALRERWEFPLELRRNMNSSALHLEFDALASPDGWHVQLDPHKNWKQALRLRLRAYDPVHHGRPDVSIERALQGRDRTTDSSRSGYGVQLTGQLGVNVRHDTNEVLASVTASGSASRHQQHEAQHGAGGVTRATYAGPVHTYRSDVVVEVTAIRWKGGTTESETTYLHITQGMDSLVPHRLVSDLGLAVPEHVQARMDEDDKTPAPRRGPHRLLDDGVTEVPLRRYREPTLGVLTGHVEQLHGAGVLTHIEQVLRERGLLPRDAVPRPNLRMQALRHRFSEEALAGNFPALLGNGVHAWMPLTGAFGQTRFVSIRVTAKAFEAVEHWTRPETTLLLGGERSTALSEKQVAASDRKVTGEAEGRGSVGSVKFSGGGEAGWLSKSSDTRWISKNTKDVFRVKTRDGSQEFTHPLRYRVEINGAAQGPHVVHWLGTRVKDGVLTLGSLSSRFLGTGNEVAAFWYSHQVGSWSSDSAAEGKVIDGSVRTLVPDHLTSVQPRAHVDPEVPLIDRRHTLGKGVHWHTGARPAPGPVETELAAHLLPKAFPASEAVARWAALTTLPPRQRPADPGVGDAWQVPGLGLDSKHGMRLRLSATDGVLRVHSGELLGHTYRLPLRDGGSVTVGLRVVRAQQVAEAQFKDRSYSEVEDLPLAFRTRARGWDVASRSYASGPGADGTELRGTGGLSYGRAHGTSEEDETRLDYDNNSVTSRDLRYYGFDVEAFLIGPYGTLAMEVPEGLYGMLPTDVAEGLHAAHPDLFHGPAPTAEAKGKAPEAEALDDLMAGWEPPAAGSSTAPVRHLADRLRDAGLVEGSSPLRLRAGDAAHPVDLARAAAERLGRPIDLILDSGIEQRIVPGGTDRSGAATPAGSVGPPSGTARDTDPDRSEAGAPATVVTEVSAPETDPPPLGALPS
ncbi:glycosyltransferase [Streptomyces lydicus]|uniref:scabin-related ADP-ribosyltransferase n=1 Tax=Streptomyces lydicus TaxID=47763 RepID=UPI002E37283F|nr:glycosyltransferase [Streptomyces lydicus]